MARKDQRMLGVYLTVEMYDKIHEIATSKNITLTKLVRQLIFVEIYENERREESSGPKS